MKIINVIPTLESGGAERALSNIVNSSSNNKFIIITLFHTNVFYEIKDNVQIIHLNNNNDFLGKIKVFFQLYKVINNIKPDIVNYWMKTSVYSIVKYFMSFDYKTIFNYRNSYYSEKKSAKILTKFVSKISDGNIFVSNEAYESRKNNNYIINDHTIIGNGFLIKNYNYKLHSKITFGYIGRYHPVKNQKMLINALNKIKEKEKTNIIIAGRNLTKNKFQYVDVSLNIKWMGEISNTDLFYDSIDCLILTSLHEGFPNVIGEAMSRGIPVITTNAGESFNIVGENGYCIKDEFELVETIDNIINEPEQLLNKSINSYNRINRNYSLDVISSMYNAYYEKIGEKK